MSPLVVGLLLFAFNLVDGNSFRVCTVMYQEGKWYFDMDVVAINQAALATFHDTLNVTGWGVLNVRTDSNMPDRIQAFAAGYAEGILTAPRIYQQYLNVYNVLFKDSPPTPKLRTWFEKQSNWTRQMIRRNLADHYWQHVENIVAQFDGLVAGYAAAVDARLYPIPHLNLFAFQMLNANGDLFDILPALNRSSQIDWASKTPDEITAILEERQRCSAFVKVSGNYSDLFMGHSAFYHYSVTNRIWKHYQFFYRNPRTAAQKLSFSSYPGYLVSMDDFYMMSSGLGMVQTTIENFNNTLYDLYITPESLLAWQRVRLCNAMAHNGSEWYKVYATHASGTYTNQYVIVDYNRFVPNHPLPDDVLWVVEEIPGLVAGGDQTATLRFGYWPSYNVPFWKSVYVGAGYPQVVDRVGLSMSYELSPRAEQFRRDAGTAIDFERFKHLMRYNDYQHDPYSQQRPSWAICSRGDLDPTRPRPGGCYDTKVTSAVRFKGLSAEAINGPTTQGQPPFRWAAFANVSHIGLPAVYNFRFVVMQPAALP